MHFPVRFAALISTVYVLSCYAIHEAVGVDERNTAVRMPGFQAFSPSHYGQMQLPDGLDKFVERSMTADFGVANGASKFGSQFAYAAPPNTGSMNFQKRMDSPGLMPPMRGASVFPNADRSSLQGQVSKYGGGFQNGNYWNTGLWPANRMQLFNNPSRNTDTNSDFPGKETDSSADVSSTNVGMLNKTTEPEFRPRNLRGRKRNNWRRSEVSRKDNLATTEVSPDSTPKVENKVDVVTDGTLSDDGITTSFTTIEVTKDFATEVVVGTLSEIEENTGTEVVGDIGTISDSSGKSDVPATTTEEALGSALSSFMEATTDRLCLPAAMEDMKMVLTGLAPSGSVSMTTLPIVVADLMSHVQDAYPELSPSEVAAQAFTELCTALLHVLSDSPSAENKVNYSTIPETANIVSLMIQSGLDI